MKIKDLITAELKEMGHDCESCEIYKNNESCVVRSLIGITITTKKELDEKSNKVVILNKTIAEALKIISNGRKESLSVEDITYITDTIALTVGFGFMDDSEVILKDASTDEIKNLIVNIEAFEKAIAFMFYKTTTKLGDYIKARKTKKSKTSEYSSMSIEELIKGLNELIKELEKLKDK